MAFPIHSSNAAKHVSSPLSFRDITKVRKQQDQKANTISERTIQNFSLTPSSSSYPKRSKRHSFGDQTLPDPEIFDKYLKSSRGSSDNKISTEFDEFDLSSTDESDPFEEETPVPISQSKSRSAPQLLPENNKSKDFLAKGKILLKKVKLSGKKQAKTKNLEKSSCPFELAETNGGRFEQIISDTPFLFKTKPVPSLKFPVSLKPELDKFSPYYELKRTLWLEKDFNPRSIELINKTTPETGKLNKQNTHSLSEIIHGIFRTFGIDDNLREELERLIHWDQLEQLNRFKSIDHIPNWTPETYEMLQNPKHMKFNLDNYEEMRLQEELTASAELAQINSKYPDDFWLIERLISFLTFANFSSVPEFFAKVLRPQELGTTFFKWIPAQTFPYCKGNDTPSSNTFKIKKTEKGFTVSQQTTRVFDIDDKKNIPGVAWEMYPNYYHFFPIRFNFEVFIPNKKPESPSTSPSKSRKKDKKQKKNANVLPNQEISGKLTVAPDVRVLTEKAFYFSFKETLTQIYKKLLGTTSFFNAEQVQQQLLTTFINWKNDRDSDKGPLDLSQTKALIKHQPDWLATQVPEGLDPIDDKVKTVIEDTFDTIFIESMKKIYSEDMERIKKEFTPKDIKYKLKK